MHSHKSDLLFHLFEGGVNWQGNEVKLENTGEILALFFSEKLENDPVVNLGT